MSKEGTVTRYCSNSLLSCPCCPPAYYQPHVHHLRVFRMRSAGSTHVSVKVSDSQAASLTIHYHCFNRRSWEVPHCRIRLAGLLSSSMDYTTPSTEELDNVTPTQAFIDEADDAIWILTSTFIIFTMQSGKVFEIM